MGVRLFSESVRVFTDPAGVGVEAAEELAKATGVCVSVRACEHSAERHLRGLHGRPDMKGLGEERGKAGDGWTDGLIAVDCLFLRRADERVTRCSSHNILGCASLSLCKCPP